MAPTVFQIRTAKRMEIGWTVMKRPADRLELHDSLMLFGVVLFSALPYLFGLGFYSDDWAFQAMLDHASRQGVGATFQQLLTHDASTIVRPVQVVYLVLGFEMFGRHPLPYHLVNTVVLGLAVVFLYLGLKEIRLGRWLAFVVAVVFGLLPHYSTDRFWIASHQATLSMAFAFIGIYALSRSMRLETSNTARWLALAVLALVLSILSYEVALGLIIASLLITGWRGYVETRKDTQRRFSNLAGVAGVAGVLLLIGMVKTRLQTQIVLSRYTFKDLVHLVRHFVVQAIQFNLWTYCLHMPWVLLSLSRHSALSSAAVGTATILAFLVTAYLWRYMDPSAAPDWRMCLQLLAMGFVIFGLGFVLFFPNDYYDFSAVGSNSRIVIASALGASCVLVALAGLACSVLKSQVRRARAFSLSIGLICGLNSLAVSGIGYFWVDAASRQAAIRSSVATNVRSLPAGSVLLLDGFCRFSGPGVIFETDWDAGGVIQLLLNDSTLSGDVVSRNMRFGDAAVKTSMYGSPEGSYTYGNQLFVYNVKTRTLANLPSRKASNEYLHQMNPTGDSGCPAGQEGFGTKVF
jgi:hypothetical protein